MTVLTWTAASAATLLLCWTAWRVLWRISRPLQPLPPPSITALLRSYEARINRNGWKGMRT